MGFAAYEKGQNTLYGRLARRLAEAIGCAPRTPHLLLLAEFAKPATLTNRHWVLILRPAFLEALRRTRLAGHTSRTRRQRPA